MYISPNTIFYIAINLSFFINFSSIWIIINNIIKISYMFYRIFST